METHAVVIATLLVSVIVVLLVAVLELTRRLVARVPPPVPVEVTATAQVDIDLLVKQLNARLTSPSPPVNINAILMRLDLLSASIVDYRPILDVLYQNLTLAIEHAKTPDLGPLLDRRLLAIDALFTRVIAMLAQPIHAEALETALRDVRERLEAMPLTEFTTAVGLLAHRIDQLQGAAPPHQTIHGHATHGTVR